LFAISSAQEVKQMAKYLSALACGIVFGLGLCISQMMNPQKVLGFLDVAGAWDPSLALVMAGALAIAGAAWRMILHRPAPLLEQTFQLPKVTDIDPPLIAGAAIFGIGWGLSGFCPGPAIATLSLAIPENYVFTAAMFAGMGLFQILQARQK
jgi:uncharacterized membrane protein YedE/YeeE